MRITAGTYRSRRVACPPGIIRPAMDRMRESLFSILGPIAGMSFLDVFSGSGIMSLEAASRGASRIHLVEKDKGKRNVLLKNLEIAQENISCSFLPAERFIRSWKEAFDIIYLDPPFDYPQKERLLKMISSSSILKDDSRVLIHFPKEDKIPSEIQRLICTDERSYGRSQLRFYTIA
mgnify:CR=1 FL=1